MNRACFFGHLIYINDIAMTSVQIENLNQIKQASYLKHVSKFEYPWDEHLNAQPASGMKHPNIQNGSEMLPLQTLTMSTIVKHCQS